MVPRDFSDAPTSVDVTLGEVLQIPELTRAHAEIIVGHKQMDRPVRWAHVAESPRSGNLLSGGELLLTTGFGFGFDEGTFAQRVRDIADNGAAGILVELGDHWKELPDQVRDECKRLDLPLIVVREEIRFVAVTEEIHARILKTQVEQNSLMREINESFWVLMYNGAPPEQLVVHAARVLACPVVLEDLSHRVVYFSEGHELPSTLLVNWGERSRAWSSEGTRYGAALSPQTVDDPDFPGVTWSFIDIQARGAVWGRLFYRGTPMMPAIGAHVLRHAAMALSIERLSTLTPHSWSDLIDRTSLERLLNTRFTTVEGEGEMLKSVGFRVTGRLLVAMELRFRSDYRTPSEVRNLFNNVPEIDALITCSAERPEVLSCAFSLPETHGPETVLTALRAHLSAAGTSADIIVSGPVHGPVELASALRQVHNAQVAPLGRGVQVYSLSQSHTNSLMQALRDDIRVQAFVEGMLQPLLNFDRRNDGDLVQVLGVILQHPTSRSAAAEAMHLSRTALYHRIATIERLLAVDLNDGDTQFSLGLALRCLGQHSP